MAGDKLGNRHPDGGLLRALDAAVAAIDALRSGREHLRDRRRAASASQVAYQLLSLSTVVSAACKSSKKSDGRYGDGLVTPRLYEMSGFVGGLA